MSNINITPFHSKGYEKAELIKVENKDGVAVVSSRVVAQDFGKRHSHVCDTIRNLIAENSEVKNMMIRSSYEHRGNTYDEYLLTRDGFSLLVMGFTGKEALQWKLQYIEAFNKMEEQIKQQSHNPYANLSPELQSIIMLDQKQQMLEQNQTKLNQRMTELEENARLEAGEYSLVSKRISSRINVVLKERGINRHFIGELYKALNRDIKEVTGIQTRTQLRQKHLNMVLELINDWQPSRATIMSINQMSLEI